MRTDMWVRLIAGSMMAIISVLVLWRTAWRTKAAWVIAALCWALAFCLALYVVNPFQVVVAGGIIATVGLVLALALQKRGPASYALMTLGFGLCGSFIFHSILIMLTPGLMVLAICS